MAPVTQEQSRVSKFTEELDNEDEVDSNDIPHTCGKNDEATADHKNQKTNTKPKSPPSDELPDSTIILPPIQPAHLSKPRLYETPIVATDGGIDHDISAVPPKQDHSSSNPSTKRRVVRSHYTSTFDLEYDTVSRFQDLNLKKGKAATKPRTSCPYPESRPKSPRPFFNFHTIAEDDGGRPHLALALDHMRNPPQEVHNPTKTRRLTPKDPREGRRNGHKRTLFPYPFYPPEEPSAKAARLAASKVQMKVLIAREAIGLLAKLPPDNPTITLALEEILGSSRLMDAAASDLSAIRTAKPKHRDKEHVTVPWTLAAFRKVWDGSKTWPKDVQVDALSEGVVAVYEERHGKGSLPTCGCVSVHPHVRSYVDEQLHEARPQQEAGSLHDDKPSHQSPTDSGHESSDSGSSITVVPSSHDAAVAPNVCDAAAQAVLADLDKALARFEEALMLARSIAGSEDGAHGLEGENGGKEDEDEDEEEQL